jgi:hypothetical protein
MEKQSNEPEFQAFRKRVLTGSLILCCVGLPVGIALKIPYVWILSIIGIIFASLKLLKMKSC